MSFFPTGFDFRSDTVVAFRLVEVDTPHGVFRFLMGADGCFTDVHGREWWGSQLITAEGAGFGLGGTAKASSLSLGFYVDPADPSDLIAELRALGSDYVKGRPLRKFLQVFDTPDHAFAPVHPPRQYARAIMDHITFGIEQDTRAVITLHLENEFRVRGGARARVLNTSGHSEQVGAPNPSYEFIPTDPRRRRPFLG